MGENLFAWNIYVTICIICGMFSLVIYLSVQLGRSERKKKEFEDQYKELENKLNNIQLETIDSKLNPHLFKNILNSIQAHAYQTYFAIDKLANVLDYILYDSHKKYVILPI